jgi:uncharacterized membrane protein
MSSIRSHGVTFGKGVILLLGLGVGGYAAYAYGFLPLGSLVHPQMGESFRIHYLGIYCHAFASVVAISFGPLQFSKRLRASRPNVHRWIGRLYLFIGVMLGGLSGLYMAVFAFGGPIAKVGFALLALTWLYSGYRAYAAVRQRRIDEHRRWMMRNYALTFSAVTLRLYLPLGGLAQIPFEVVYPTVAWLAWIPNLLIVEWIMQRGIPSGELATSTR